MNENKKVRKCTNDAIKIILYVVFMTTLFLLYFSDNNNYEIENSIVYHSAEYNSYYRNVIKTDNSNIHFVIL